MCAIVELWLRAAEQFDESLVHQRCRLERVTGGLPAHERPGDPSQFGIDERHELIHDIAPFRNAAGHVATFSTQGFVDLTSEYFQPQGSNGRSCSTCHVPQEAWSITPATIQRLFDQTEGLHPIFNLLDANNPAADLSTIAAREAAFSMLLSRGVFRRGGTLCEAREWNLVAVDDPHGFASLTRLVHWRRAMPTINFALGSAVVNWDGGNSVGSEALSSTSRPHQPPHALPICPSTRFATE